MGLHIDFSLKLPLFDFHLLRISLFIIFDFFFSDLLIWFFIFIISTSLFWRWCTLTIHCFRHVSRHSPHFENAAAIAASAFSRMFLAISNAAAPSFLHLHATWREYGHCTAADMPYVHLPLHMIRRLLIRLHFVIFTHASATTHFAASLTTMIGRFLIDFASTGGIFHHRCY